MVVLDNANNLDWGFVEYPPLTPFLARIELTLFGLSLVSARTFSALSSGVIFVLTGLMARELGGNRRTQIVAAFAAGIAPFALMLGMLVQYVTFDFLWSVLIAYFVIRLLKSEDPRWWIPIGGVIGSGDDDQIHDDLLRGRRGWWRSIDRCTPLPEKRVAMGRSWIISIDLPA